MMKGRFIMTGKKSLKHFQQILFDYKKSDLHLHEIENTLLVLHSVAHVFNISIPLDKISPLTIIVDTTREMPTCFRSINSIYLSSPHTEWNRLAYQFAHELCHYIIASDVPTNLCWLEESICELSSYYFLPKITKYWKRLGIELQTADEHPEPYFPLFSTYVEKDCKKAVPFNLAKLALSPSQDLYDLENNCKLREKNAYIANNFLPIFKKHYRTWRAIPYLCQITPHQSLSNSLAEWIELSPPESHTGLIEIARLFGAQESLL